MLYLLFFFFSPFTATVADTSDIVIQLEDEFIEGKNGHFFQLEYENLNDEQGRPFVRFKVDQKFSTAVSGFRYYGETENYSEYHTPINVDIYSEDIIVISFDDNMDGVYDDRDTIVTSEGVRAFSQLLFKHNSDEKKDLKIKCQIAVELVNSDYQLYVYYATKSKGEIEISGKKTPIYFWKSLGTFDLKVGKHGIKRGNPFRLNKEFYRVTAYNPVANTLTISRIGSDEKLYGTSKNLYASEVLFDEALAFHNINKTEVADKKYHVLYFWGHWCGPCMSKMGATSNTLNALKSDIAVYNVSLITGNYDDEEIIVRDIVSDYNLPDYAVIEKHSITSNTRPFINLFDNRSYPNFMVLDSDYKILYIEDDADISFAEYAATLE